MPCRRKQRWADQLQRYPRPKLQSRLQADGTLFRVLVGRLQLLAHGCQDGR